MSKYYITSDLSVAAYLKIKGFLLVEATKRNGKFLFKFEDPQGKGHQLRIEFLNSEFKAYANAERDLKTGMYETVENSQKN